MEASSRTSQLIAKKGESAKLPERKGHSQKDKKTSSGVRQPGGFGEGGRAEESCVLPLPAGEEHEEDAVIVCHRLFTGDHSLRILQHYSSLRFQKYKKSPSNKTDICTRDFLIL